MEIKIISGGNTNIDKSDFYNSNSYFTGIGQAAGLPIPQISVQAPGYNKPVPPSYFINPNEKRLE
jgi:hypothetical protein